MKLKAILPLIAAGLIAVQPAEAGILKKVGFIVKKTVVCPVYFVGGATVGAATGLFFWYHIGGHEGDLKKAFSGGM